MPREVSPSWVRTAQHISSHVATGTSAEEIITDFVPGFRQRLAKATYIQGATAGAGAGASRELRIIKNASTVMASRTLLLADTNAGKGVASAFTLATADGYLWLDDDDTFTVDVVAGGTQFTTGPVGSIILVWRQHPQAAY